MLFNTGDTRTAAMSPCGSYRYRLTREWADGSRVHFVMLNPSVADALIDDRTIRKCIGFARRWGHGSLVVTNLFAYRATDPAVMKAADDPVGPFNDAYIRHAAASSHLTVCAWGVDGVHRGRDAEVLGIIREAAVEAWALRLTKDGHPWHPLYIANATRPFLWREGSRPQ